MSFLFLEFDEMKLRKNLLKLQEAHFDSSSLFKIQMSKTFSFFFSVLNFKRENRAHRQRDLSREKVMGEGIGNESQRLRKIKNKE